MRKKDIQQKEVMAQTEQVGSIPKKMKEREIISLWQPNSLIT